MYAILVIDDEVYSAEGLRDYLSDNERHEFDVRCAYSASEALGILRRTKIDIVISDIHMPEMDGLALHEAIIKQWPRIKTIFLTGFNDFRYVQQALRNKAVDYLLKTEGDEKILEAVDKAIDAFAEERVYDQTIASAHQQMVLAKPVLQKELLAALLERPANTSPTVLARRFKELAIKLAPDQPCLLVTARIDAWGYADDTYDRYLLQYAVQNIAEEYLNAGAIVHTVTNNDFRFQWILQRNEHRADNWDEQSFKLFVHGTLDDIQRTCRQMLRIPISIIAGDSMVGWCGMAEEMQHLNHLLSAGSGQNEMLLIYRNEGPLQQQEKNERFIRRLNDYIERHIAEDVSLTRLGDAFGLSPSYLCRLYKQLTDSTLSGHITAVKLARAQHLLLHSDLKVNEIGKRIGFESPAYFARFFRKYIRKSPQEFRDYKEE
jgi:two-component system response regulator YesN